MDELKDRIFTTKTAYEMLDMISPIYDNSYLALWIIEVIAREYARIINVAKEIPDQAYPETATWSISLWEDRYGVTPYANQTLAERRVNVILRRDARSPVNPAKIKSIVRSITGTECEVVENSESYTFAVYVTAGTDRQLDEIAGIIRRIKPAHLSFDVINSIPFTFTDYQGISLLRQKTMVFKEV